MNLLNLFDIVDAVAAQKQSPTDNVVNIPATVQASQANGQPATIVVPVTAADEVEVLEDDHEDSLNIGDEVIIAGNVQYQGKTGRVVDFGRNKHFVVVDLYNFGKHSFHSSNVEHNDYADSEEEDANWRERDHGLFGDDERDEVSEDNGGYYYEQLAQKVFDERPNFSTKGRADELVDYAYRFAVQDLGKSRARYEFNYDEDFLSDFVSAYGELQRGEQGVAEEYDPSYDPEYRGYQKPERNVDWDIEAERNAPEEPEAAKTVTVTDNNGKVVLTFPSTGGFYGDLRYATGKGFDTDSGDYHLSWKRDTNEGNNWLDTPVSEEFDRIKKLAGLK